MVSCAFRKLYADLVTADGSVCIVYVVWSELLGLRHGSAGYELYTPDGRREVVHSRTVPSLPPTATNEWTLRLEVPGGAFELTQRAARDAVPTQLELPGLRWCVRMARCDAEARWLEGPRREALRGVGYADWVELSKSPRALGLSRIDWGRAHVGARSVVWNRLQRAQGSDAMRVLISEREHEFVHERFDLDAGRVATRVGVTVQPQLSLERSRVLHEGSPFDRQRLPSALLRIAARLLSSPMRETRCISRAVVAGSADSGWALHECVQFVR